MIHLPWIMFMIGNIGYALYQYDPGFWFRNTNDRVNDDFVMLASGFIAFIGLVLSVIIYGSMLLS